MQTEKNISIYGIDCTVLTTLPEIEQAVLIALRSAPDLIVFHAPGKTNPTFLSIVNDAYASGSAVMLTSNRLTAPRTTNWLSELVK